MKILVIAMSGIGDTLIATPLIDELHANFPEAQIDVLVMWAGAKDLLGGNPYVTRVWQNNVIKEGAARTIRFLLGLRRQRYDMSLNAHTQGRLAYRVISALVGARLRVGHAYENTQRWERMLIHKTVPEDYTVHSVENNNRLLPLIGAKTLMPTHPMRMVLTDAEKAWAEEYVAAHHLNSYPCLGVHVGSGGTKNLALKRWPLGQWIAFLREFTAARPDAAVLMFGGPEEKEPHARIREALPKARLLTPESKNMRQAGALMPQCSAFLSVDTALMHLAAAMKVRNQIVIEAPTLNPTNFPHGNEFTVVRNPAINGRNLDYYRYNGKPIQGTDDELRALMSAVKVEDVLATVLAKLPHH